MKIDERRERAAKLYVEGWSQWRIADHLGVSQKTVSLDLAWVQEKQPSLAPKTILDMGCAIGNSTLAWSRAFPKAQVHGIDVGAPVLRYAHARAQELVERHPRQLFHEIALHVDGAAVGPARAGLRLQGQFRNSIDHRLQRLG